MLSPIVKTAALGLLWMLCCARSSTLAQDVGVAGDSAADPVASDLRSRAEEPRASTGARADANASVLALAVGPDLVDRDALRLALQAELGVAVEDAGSAPAYMPTLSVMALPNGNVEVALSSRTVPRSTREFSLSAQLPAERVEMVTLIAANLIRNEAAALLPELQPAPVPAPVAAAPAKPKPTLIDPCNVKDAAEFGIDFAPGVGSSSTPRGRNATRRVSLGFVGTMSGRLHGLEFSFGANIVKKSVCGVQLSTGANISAGPLVGAQFANFNLINGPLTGAQWAIANVITGDVTGTQLGIANMTVGSITGAQLGVANYQGGKLTGIQGGVANYAGKGVTGLQAGVLGISIGDQQGAQLGVANFTQGRITGLQAGVGNFAIGGISGAQLGVANVSAGPVRGVQLGVFNYADASDASIGLLSIVRRGRTSLDLTAAVDTSLAFLSVTHGGKYIHNILGVGVVANPGQQRLATMYGLGLRALNHARIKLDIEAVIQHVYNDDLQSKGVSLATGVRVPVTVMLYKGLGIMAAPSWMFSVIEKDESREIANFRRTSVDNGDPRVSGFPGITFGLRYQFDHGA